MLDLTLIVSKLEVSLPQFFKSKNIIVKIVILEEVTFKLSTQLKILEYINSLSKRKRFGAAIIEGVEISDTKFFCIINADGSMNPVYLNEMIKKIKKVNLILYLLVDMKNRTEGVMMII